MKQIAMILVLQFLAAPALFAGQLPTITVSADGRGFAEKETGRPFTPWGFNYDHDERGRLIEDYWLTEWPKVVEDFGEMKALGANVVRIHLQLGKFLESRERPNEVSMAQLAKLLKLAEEIGLYLDITGLGCYHKADVPAWYDALTEQERWQTQAVFWEAVAKTCGQSSAVFCYDLMNEPVVPGGRRESGQWLGPAFAGKHFVQFISLDRQDRERQAIARAWIQELKSAIRRQDQVHLVTVGLVDWSLDQPGLTSGFVPATTAGELDFIAVHLYPKAGKVDDAIATLRGFDIGKPIVIEETFPLHCSSAELATFFDTSSGLAKGWIGFYWGRTPAEYRPAKTIADAMTLQWLELFQSRSKEMSEKAMR